MSLRDRFDLVILDWAGTMVDFGCQAPVKALLEAFAAEGVVIDVASARRDMGKSKVDHVRGLLQIPVVAAAWRSARGHVANDSDVELLMRRLGPLMRKHAAAAATLIPGAKDTVQRLRALGFKIASSTGYTREMMAPVLELVAAEGYVPDHLVCAGETPFGRPTPLMIYKACAELGVWPLSRVVKVDDAEAGIAEGKAAGAFTIGIAATGNTVGLSLDEWKALSANERTAYLESSERVLRAAGAELVIESIADLIPALERYSL
jgi:phosphonoacetaldehyde hydrolase